MAKRTILAVGCELPGEPTSTTSLKTKLSLLDYDIVIFDPIIMTFLYGATDFQGKPCLDDTNSFDLKEHMEHWKREILDAIKADKTVFILLNERQEVFVETGEKTHSGTGRNRQTTRNVVPISNYSIIPGSIHFTSAQGSSMRLCDGENVLKTYWSEFGEESSFRVLIESEGVKPLVRTKTGDKKVGGLIKYKGAPGALILLPYIPLTHEDFTYWDEEEDSDCWTDEALSFGKRFVSAICSVDKAIKRSGNITPTPKWVAQDKYSLPKEDKARVKLLATERKIESLQQEKEEHKKKITDESILKGLLYENGKHLEKSVIDALKLMGFSASQYRDNESEFDVVFESEEGRFIGEAEGKDKKAINIDKLRQLEMNILEDFDREGIQDIAKGVLFGNAHRLSKPEDRSDFFTQKCRRAAARSGTALIRTTDLFVAVKYLSKHKDTSFSRKCRRAILDTTGIVEFPRVPVKPSPITKVSVKARS